MRHTSDPRLSHATEGVFHRTRLNAPAAGGQSAGPEALGKDLEDGYGVAWQAVGVGANGTAESRPERPRAGFGRVALS